MEAMVYKNRQYAINLLTINITNFGTKKKVVENTSQRPEIIGGESRIVLVAVLMILSVGFMNPLVQIIPSDDEFA